MCIHTLAIYSNDDVAMFIQGMYIIKVIMEYCWRELPTKCNTLSFKATQSRVVKLFIFNLLNHR